MHRSNIQYFTILYQKCAYVCTFVLQNGALWNICRMHNGICENCLLDDSVRKMYYLSTPLLISYPTHYVDVIRYGFLNWVLVFIGSDIVKTFLDIHSLFQFHNLT